MGAGKKIIVGNPAATTTAEDRFTIIDDGRPLDVRACIDGGRVRLASDALRNALGIEIKPQGLCRGAVCVPIRDTAVLVTEDGIDLATCADLLGCPLALDVEARAGYLGVPAPDRGRDLASLDAPDFTLPDLNGHPHSLSDYRGKKVLLIAHASW
jgi:hypothetical protein